MNQFKYKDIKIFIDNIVHNTYVFLFQKHLDVLKESAFVSFFMYVLGIIFLSYMHTQFSLPYNIYSFFVYSIDKFFVILYALLMASKNGVNRVQVMLCLLPAVVWNIAYTYIFGTINHTSENHTYYMILYVLYYSAGTLLSLVLLSFSCFLSIQKLPQILSLTMRFLSTILSFIMMAIPVSYVIYFTKYHSLFDEISLMSIIATNIQESKEYISTMFTQEEVLTLFLIIVVIFCISYRITYFKKTDKHSYSGIKKVTFISVLFFLMFTMWNKGATYFPLDTYAKLNQLDGGPMHAFEELKKNIDRNNRALYLTDSHTTADAVPGTVIVVIGESACRDYMHAFNENYPHRTTPWETRMKMTPDFIFFSSAYSNFSNTVMALTQVLTSSNQYNEQSLGEAADIIDVAHKAGYHTYWISTQDRNGIWDAGVTEIAEHADYKKWIEGKDDQILRELKSIPTNQNNFIILHLSGSHYKYTEKVPDEFARDHRFSAPEEEADYDTSLAFTDDNLKNIFNYANTNMNLQVMTYFSDHGENLKYKHVSEPFYYDMIRIPFWIYLSPWYREQYPDIANTLRAHRESVFTNDMMFETMSGILHTKSNFYDEKYDFSNQQYSITWQDAKTMRGELRIADDPDLNKAVVGNNLHDSSQK